MIGRIRRIVKRIYKEGYRTTLFWNLNKIGSCLGLENLYFRSYEHRYGNKIRKKNYEELYEFYAGGGISENKNLELEGKIPVFVCWFQGIENAPRIVLACYKQLYRVLDKEHYQIVTITMDNYREYVNFPSFIVERVEKKKMTLTHFSDLLRVNLLINYGGIWIDSTMLMTGSLPEDIMKGDLFVFKSNYQFEYHKEIGSSTFIYVHSPQNEILKRTLLGLYLYWDEHESLEYYSLFHCLFAIAVSANEKTRAMYEEVPFYCAFYNIALQTEMFEEYDSKRFDYLKSLSFVQKLTYKFDAEKDIRHTNYEHIIQSYMI